MPILNYTTDVPAERTIAQVIGLLARKGAQSITQDFFDDGRVKAVRFLLKVGGIPTCFSLPVNIDGVAGVLMTEKPYSYRASHITRDQWIAKQREAAERISWRILKDWIEAQMALIESGQAEVGQVFMPYAQQRDGRTMYEFWLEANQKQIGAGQTEERA